MDFVTLTSYNNYFKKYPEKVAGIEIETTSMYFPIVVKGTKADVYRVTGITDPDTQDRQANVEIEKANALKLKLLLLKHR